MLTGEDGRRLPDIRRVDRGARASGDGWIGIERNGAYVVRAAVASAAWAGLGVGADRDCAADVWMAARGRLRASTMTVEERVRQQFPGMFVTLVSVLIGLVFADLVSEAHERMILWPLSAEVLRTWAQLITVSACAVGGWIVYAHIGISRQRVASLPDTLIAFLNPLALLVLTGLSGRAESWPWFYWGSAFCLIAVLAAVWQNYLALEEPELAPFRRLLRPTGYLGVLYACAPAMLLFGWADQNGWLSTCDEAICAAVGAPAAMLCVHLFVRDWGQAIAAASSATAPTSATSAR